MRLTARARANRRNAKRSTGPRTAAGRERVAGNAFKHGLAVPILQTSGAEARIKDMARAIAGEGADPMHLELASRIAAAQLDLVRIKEVKRRLSENPEARRKQISGYQKVLYLNRMLRLYDRIEATPDHVFHQNEAAMEAARELSRLHSEMFGPPPPLDEGFGNLAPQLLRLDRYERRAVSRRKMAIRAYDAYCAAEAQGRGDASCGADEAAPFPEKSDAD